MDGRQVLGEVLSVHPEQAVIVLSCVADVAAKVDLLERGAQDYLTKPFSLAELLARVRVRLRSEAHHAEQHHQAADALADPQPLMPPLTAPQPTSHAHSEIIRAGHVTLDVGKLVADIGQGPVPLDPAGVPAAARARRARRAVGVEGKPARLRLGLRLRPRVQRGGRVRAADPLQAWLRADQDRAG